MSTIADTEFTLLDSSAPGVTTTAPFLSRVMTHPVFRAGDIDTKFLEREGQLMKEPV